GGAGKTDVLRPAHLAHLDDRRRAFRSPRDSDAQPHRVRVSPIGRAARYQQQSSPGLAQTLDHVGTPDVFADRDAEANAAENDRAWQRTRGEHAFLVEDAVVRQIDFEIPGGNDAVGEKAIRVVE